MRAVLIANGNAGRHRREDFASAVESAAGGLVQDRFWTTGPRDAERIARTIALQGGCDAIFAAGGDGTVNEVASGIIASATPCPPAVGIIPMGTCNILAGELGIPIDASGVRCVLEQGERRSIDVGIAGERCFLMMAGFGFDAAAVRNVAPPIKGAFGASAYVLSFLMTLVEFGPSNAVIRIDDDVVRKPVFMVLVANVSSYAHRQVKLAPFASLDDGWLDVCIFEKAPAAKAGFVTQATLTMARRRLTDPRVRYYRGRRVTVETEPQMPAHFDGESCGQTPVTIELAPKRLEFLVPAINPKS